MLTIKVLRNHLVQYLKVQLHWELQVELWVVRAPV